MEIDRSGLVMDGLSLKGGDLFSFGYVFWGGKVRESFPASQPVGKSCSVGARSLGGKRLQVPQMFSIDRMGKELRSGKHHCG